MDWSFKTFHYMNDFDHQMSKKWTNNGNIFFGSYESGQAPACLKGNQDKG